MTPAENAIVHASSVLSSEVVKKTADAPIPVAIPAPSDIAKALCL